MSFLDYLNQASATNSVRQIRKMIPKNPSPLIEVSGSSLEEASLA